MWAEIEGDAGADLRTRLVELVHQLVNKDHVVQLSKLQCSVPTPCHRYSAGQQRPTGIALKNAMLSANTSSPLLGWSTKAKWYSTQNCNAHCQHLVTVTRLVNKGQVVQHSKTQCSLPTPCHRYSAGQQRPTGTALKNALLSINTSSLLLGGQQKPTGTVLAPTSLCIYISLGLLRTVCSTQCLLVLHTHQTDVSCPAPLRAPTPTFATVNRKP